MIKKNKEEKEIEEGNYIRCWKYIKESKIYFLVIILIFLFSISLGFFYPVFFIELIRKIIEELVEKTSGMNFFQLLFFIIQNNLMTAFFGFILGIFLGLVPLFMTFFNGYVLGFVSNLAVSEIGILSLWRLFPHGIFEMPALILSLGLGLKLSRFIFSRKGKRKETLKYDLENSLRVFIFVILPLLIIAGIIETGLMFLLE